MKNMCCPITGVYLPRFVPAVLAGFAYIFGLGYIIHSKLLAGAYEQTPQLWRTVEDMQGHFCALLLSQFLIALITALIYTRNHEGKGAGEGVRYGIMIGALIGVLMAAPYAWMPVSLNLALAWFGIGLLEGLGLGIIYAMIYKPGPCKPA